MFEEFVKHMNAQKEEARELRRQLDIASEAAAQANLAVQSQLDDVVQSEREKASSDRQDLLAQITDLILKQGTVQDERLGRRVGDVRASMIDIDRTFQTAHATYSTGMDAWSVRGGEIVEDVLRTRETLKGKLKDDWMVSYRAFR